MDDRPVHVRWMIRRDMLEVLAIENASFASPWTEEEFLRNLRIRNVIGMVAECSYFDDGPILGYVIYETYKDRLNVANLAVHPVHRRQGIGRQLVAKLIGKLAVKRRDRVTVMVNEGSMESCLFFRKQGFLATEVIRTPYDHSEYDGIVFEYDLDAAPGVGVTARATVV